MLSSLLERSSNKVRLDRVLVEKEEEIVLITEEKEVQQEVKSHFVKQFRKRQVKDSKFISKWIEAYRSIDKIDESSYTALSEKITEQEWLEVLRDVKSKSVLDTSGISYPLIKKTGSTARRIFLVLTNKCIEEGELPIQQNYAILGFTE